MRGRSLLWAGPGVLLLGGSRAKGVTLAADPAELAMAIADEPLLASPVARPAPAEPAARAPAAYAGSSVTKTKG